jgi:hypothetical protein
MKREGTLKRIYVILTAKKRCRAMALQHMAKSIELRLRAQGRRVRRVASASHAPVQGLLQGGIWHQV